MAYEAMNNAGAMDKRLIIILNDNDMSIAPPVGALSQYLARITSSETFLKVRDIAKYFAHKLPKVWERRAARAEEFTRHLFTGGVLFEELGLYYIGPIDGHNFDHLLPVLRNVRDAHVGPVLIHVVTQKGKGYEPAENSPDKYHGVTKFNVVTGAQDKGKGGPPSYTKVFAESLIGEARKDDKIVAVTAAMPAGTGLDLFEKEFPDRCFDVGIAEQHAVTFAAGLATEGVNPSQRSIPPSCSAAMIRSCMTWPCSICRSGSCSTAPGLSVRMAPPTPAPSISPISAASPISW